MYFRCPLPAWGLTEVRALFILVNLVMYLIPPEPFVIVGVTTTYPNVISALWLAIQGATFLVIMFQTLRELAVQDPPRRAR